MLKRVQPDDGFDGRAGVAKGLRHDRRGGVGILFGLIAPLLVLAVAFGIEVTGGYRDALALQGLADRVAVSAGPLWQAGDRSGAMQLARALAGDVTIDRQGAVDAGSDTGKKRASTVTNTVTGTLTNMPTRVLPRMPAGTMPMKSSSASASACFSV